METHTQSWEMGKALTSMGVWTWNWNETVLRIIVTEALLIISERPEHHGFCPGFYPRD